MFHCIHNSLIISYLSAICWIGAQPVQAQESHYDPEDGFSLAQTNLTEIFLQLAGSLEHNGNPGLYLRHMKAEHRRIEAAYEAKFGKKLVSYCPAYMTDEYIDGLIANWDKLSPNLGLEELAKESGRRMRLAIDGDDGKGTVAVLIFNRHQDLVYDEMVASGARMIGFDRLKAEFVRLTEKGEIPFLVERETDLTAAEKASYRVLLEKKKFAKSDFPAIEKFYDGAYDKLSEYGKSQISERVHAGTNGTDVLPSDAQKYATEFWGEFESLYERLETGGTSPELSAKIKKWLDGVVFELGEIAHSELMGGTMEAAIKAD